MLTAIALAGSIFLLALLNPGEILDQYYLVSASNQLAFEVTRVRMQAVGQNVFARIRFRSETQYVRETSDDGVSYVQDGEAITLPPGMFAIVAEGGAPSFNQSGLAASSTAVTLANAGGEKRIETNVLGWVDIS